MMPVLSTASTIAHANEKENASPVRVIKIANSWQGLRANLVDEVKRYRGEKGKPAVRWRTHWKVKWRPHRGVSHYQIRIRTSEGVSKAPPVLTFSTDYQLEVAKGDNPEQLGMLARDEQLATISNLLAIQIVPVFKDGSLGMASNWLDVGTVN